MIHRYENIVAIDTVMHGWEGITAVYYLPGSAPAIIETGPGSSLQHIEKGLEEAGVEDLAWIVLTHIHLDHAGAVGHLAKRFPRARVVVRVEGARHLVDPSKLWASASRIYGDEMERLWGSIVPVPEERLEVVDSDRAIADLGGGRILRAVHSPGHASHHMAILDESSGDLFVGDAIGVYLPEAGVIRPATPPPEFDLEVSVDTIEKLRNLRAGALFPTHFGRMGDPDAAFDEGAQRLRDWVILAVPFVERGSNRADIAEAYRAKRDEWYPGLDATLVEKFEQTTSYDMNAMGIERYLRKRKEAVDAARS